VTRAIKPRLYFAVAQALPKRDVDKMKIKAAVLNQMGAEPPYDKSKPLSIDEFELDDPGHGEVMVKIGAAGLCHSDLSVIDGNRPRPTPMVLGHEAAGTVEKLGPGVDDLKVGDHVVMVFVPSCGHCLPCAEGRPALCEPGAIANNAGTLLSGARRLHRNGGDVHHHLGCSAFAEYATVSRRSLVKIDQELPFDEAALFGCAVLTGVGAVINTAKASAGSSVAVIGLGGVGRGYLPTHQKRFRYGPWTNQRLLPQSAPSRKQKCKTGEQPLDRRAA